jgi:hypothetical protein
MKLIDPKYGIEIRDGEPVMAATGEAVPADEPLILFEARDWNARFSSRAPQTTGTESGIVRCADF